MREPFRLLVSVLLVAGLVAALAGVSSAAQASRRSGDTAADRSAEALGDDAKLAPIVFIPGLVASEVSCGPSASDETNIWPGEADKFRDWHIAFSALGLIDTVHGSRISSTTVSSSDCGSAPDGKGTKAKYQPVPVSPLWCMPEAVNAITPVGHLCGDDWAGTSYDLFASDLEEQIRVDHRGQLFVSYPYDWRMPLQTQVAGLNRLLDEVTSETGEKATVVAHSMGNLLFRAWVEGEAAHHESAGAIVGRYLGLAPAYLGVANALTHAAYGDIQPGKEWAIVDAAIGIKAIQAAFSSFPGPYYLMPDEEYDAYLQKQMGLTGETWLAYRPKGSATSEWISQADVPATVGSLLSTCPEESAFPCQSEEIASVALAASESPYFGRDGIGSFNAIVGSGLDTVTQLCGNCLVWPDGSTTGSAGVPAHRSINTNGDENVPVFSATMGGSSDTPVQHYYYACGVPHTGLLQNEDVLDDYIPYLTGDAPLRYDYALRRAPCPLGSPEPRITSGSVTGPAPLKVSFSASTSTDADTIASYRWSFGNGGTASGESATHTFDTIGIRTVSLVITDSHGRSAKATITVHVLPRVHNDLSGQTAVAVAGSSDADGYWTATSGGKVIGVNVPSYGSLTSTPSPIVDLASDAATGGYWMVAANGTVHAFHAGYYGRAAGVSDVVGMAGDPLTGGYWLVTRAGGIYAFHAPFHGSMSGTSHAPIVGMAADPATGGYWLVASNGSVYGFDAPYFGSRAGHGDDIVGITTDPATFGYWLTASDGAVYAYNAPYDGELRTIGNRRYLPVAAGWRGVGYWESDTAGYGAALFSEKREVNDLSITSG